MVPRLHLSGIVPAQADALLLAMSVQGESAHIVSETLVTTTAVEPFRNV